MPRLTLLPAPAFDVEVGVNLLDASEDAGVPLESDCGGVAACNACRVQVIEGADALSPRLPEEEPFLDEDDQRLGCQACILGDVIVRPAPGL